MQPMLNIAIRAAHKAGDFIVRKINKLPDLKVEVKALNDFVSEVDRQAESLIIEELLKAFPNHSILAEESGVIEGSEDFRWIIDPLDGTTNYLHGFPHYAVSIACEHEGRLQHAAIYDPFKQELFAASRGDGATLNNRRLRVAGLKTTQGALLATGFPFRHPEQLDEFLQTFSAFFCKAWDMAAGALIVREAGGLATDFSGDTNFLETGSVVAGNPRIIGDMLRTIELTANKR